LSRDPSNLGQARHPWSHKQSANSAQAIRGVHPPVAPTVNQRLVTPTALVGALGRQGGFLPSTLGTVKWG
jgi:hypothetical protein